MENPVLVKTNWFNIDMVIKQACFPYDNYWNCILVHPSENLPWVGNLNEKNVSVLLNAIIDKYCYTSLFSMEATYVPFTIISYTDDCLR